jgi:hypothetical protein
MWLTLLITAALVFDSDMTTQEKQQTGISKLSSSEKGELQKWINDHYTKKKKSKAKEPKSMLQENLNSGSSIRLEDGTLWVINPADTPITQGWITPVDILVTPTDDPEYPYKLTNSLTGSSVKAKKG